MSAPDKYDEAFERWASEARQLADTGTVGWLRRAYLAGWKEGLREAAGIFPKQVCPACGKPHNSAFDHCPECKRAIDSGDKPA